MSRVRPWLVLFPLVCGCTAMSSPRAAHVLTVDPPQALDVALLTQLTPLPPGENIRAAPLQRGQNSSVSLVQVRDREAPHVHTRYDLSVIVAKGSGTLWLNGTPLPMQTGDVALIPKGTPHYFVNAGPEPAAALVVFAPAFTEPDQQPVP